LLLSRNKPFEERVLAELTIPQPHRAPLNKLRALSEPGLQALLIAWGNQSDEELSVDGLTPGETYEIKEAVLELHRVRDFFATDIPDFANGIARGLQRTTKFPETEIPAFRSRLEMLLTIRALSIAAKAETLKQEYERRFCTARILTDARPIYVDSPTLRPDAIMITHTARITFHDDTGEMREIYITMDDDDLVTMRDLIERAQEKAQSLQSLFATANVQIVTP
jgi:hypothetical protein